MKRLYATFMALMLMSTAAFSQNYNALNEVRENRLKAAGLEGAYRFEPQVQTKAPKGYKPFYISHYGRHGSRYAWTSKAYTTFVELLGDARDTGNLTEFGESFYSRFMDFYREPLANTGDLVELGSYQHARIAREMAHSFPKVFAGNGKVNAISSTSGRCPLSWRLFRRSQGPSSFR